MSDPTNQTSLVSSPLSDWESAGTLTFFGKEIPLYYDTRGDDGNDQVTPPSVTITVTLADDDNCIDYGWNNGGVEQEGG
jgi:hypothetical protein